MPFKWVPNAAETAGRPILAAAARRVRAATVEFTPLAKSDDGYFGFCPAKSQLYRFVVKPQHGPNDHRSTVCSCLRSWQMAGDRLIDASPHRGWNRFLFVRHWRFCSFA